MNYGKARQLGFESGHNDFVSYLDDDDYLTNQAGIEANNIVIMNMDATYTNSILLYDNGIKREYNPVWPHQLIITRRCIATLASVQSNELIKQKNWNPLVFDVVFQNIIQNAFGWHYIDKLLYVYRYHKHGIRNDKDIRIEFRKVREYFGS